MNKEINIIASIPYHGDYACDEFIGVDLGCSYLLEKDLPMVFAIGDFDSISKVAYAKLEASNTPITKLNAIKDETDLEAAIDKAKSIGYETFHIYGGIGGRLDHTLINLNLLKKKDNLIFYDDYSKIVKLEKGKHTIKKDDKYTFYSFFAIEPCMISLIDFKYPLASYHLIEDDSRCVSNEILGTQAIVETDKDIIMIASR